MGIVLPQGRFNNVSDGFFRWWISRQARILAVVGLHVNTFKPHTGTKTSVLFLQKWNDDPNAGPLCPHVKDYPIFFATSEHPGKDNSGDYIFVLDEDGQPLLDLYNHQIVDQDLFDMRSILDSQLEHLRESDKADPEQVRIYELKHQYILDHLPDRPTIAEAFIEFGRDQGLSFWREG